MVQQVIDRMHAAKRPELLMLLAAAITEITIFGRAHYDDTDPVGPLRQTNEAIHRLAGHLRCLADPSEAFTESRAAGITEQLVLLPPAAISRIFGHAA
jgi:hypothetical protein